MRKHWHICIAVIALCIHINNQAVISYLVTDLVFLFLSPYVLPCLNVLSHFLSLSVWLQLVSSYSLLPILTFCLPSLPPVPPQMYLIPLLTSRNLTLHFQSIHLSSGWPSNVYLTTSEACVGSVTSIFHNVASHTHRLSVCDISFFLRRVKHCVFCTKIIDI